MSMLSSMPKAAPWTRCSPGRPRTQENEMFGDKVKAIRSGTNSVETLIGPRVQIRGDIVFSGGLYVEGKTRTLVDYGIATDLSNPRCAAELYVGGRGQGRAPDRRRRQSGAQVARLHQRRRLFRIPVRFRVRRAADRGRSRPATRWRHAAGRSAQPAIPDGRGSR